MGAQLSAMTLAGEDGPWTSASQCGVRATLLIESAVWCDGCKPALERTLELLPGKPDLLVALVLGETQPGKPPTAADAVAYRADLAVPPSVLMLRDPLFSELGLRVDHGGGGLPFFILLDADQTILFAGTAGGAPDFPGLAGALALLP